MQIEEVLFSEAPVLVYVHDPMCSWCWGFRSAHDDLIKMLPREIRVVRLLGGLAPDSDDPMPVEMRGYLKDTWKRIQEIIPGTEFNFDYWDVCEPRRSTYPACRGVIAASELAEGSDDAMTRAIQEAYYLNSKNPSNQDTLADCAVSIGLDPERFVVALNSERTNQILMEQINLSRQMGVQGFPSLVMAQAGRAAQIRVNHTDAKAMLENIQQFLGGLSQN